MTEREFWRFLWLCMRLAYVGMPWPTATYMALWGAQLFIRRRYFAI